MKKYNYEQINEHLQWLMQMMDTEYPNNYELVVTGDYAEIRSTQTELNFLNKQLSLSEVMRNALSANKTN